MHNWYTAMYGFVRIILSVNNAEKYATAINILLGDQLHTAESDVHGRQILTSKVVPALKGLSEPASHQFYSWLSKNLVNSGLSSLKSNLAPACNMRTD